MFSRCNRPARLRVAVPGAGINRPGSLTTNFQPTKDERNTTKSLEAFIKFHTYFVPFIYRIFKLNWSLKSWKKRPNATQVLKNRQLLNSAVPSVWPNLPNYLTCTVPANNRSETASAWRHEKEVLLHRRSPNFELVEINSTLSCKVSDFEWANSKGFLKMPKPMSVLLMPWKLLRSSALGIEDRWTHYLYLQ